MSLGKQDRQRIVALYEGRLSEDTRDHSTVGWGSKADQWLRFWQLFRGYDPRKKKILDVGCGLGHLAEYLHERVGNEFTYTGVDITPGLIRYAQEMWTNSDHRFLLGDILDGDVNETFDVVVLSGALNFRIDDNVSHARSMLNIMYAMATDLVSVNFLSSYVDYQLDKNFHYQPESLFAIAKDITPRVALYHDYPLYEFTLQLRRNDNTNPKEL